MDEETDYQIENDENEASKHININEDSGNNLPTIQSITSSNNLEVNIASTRNKKNKNIFNVININDNTEKIKINESDDKIPSSSFSSVIQIPNTSFNDLINENKKISISNDNPINPFPTTTLHEPIKTTISRDLNLIFTKLKFVLNPFSSKRDKVLQIKQWDLWGPLIMDICLACFVSVGSSNKTNTIAMVFVIFWLGGFFVYLNAEFLEVKSSLFQILCLLGYCLFPLDIASIILMFLNFGNIFRFVVSSVFCFWSIFSASSFLKNITTNDKRYLVLYPCILLYLYISWFIFAK